MLARLLTAYRGVQSRMSALPVYNAELETEAVGFERRDGRMSGVLITPWCMNLIFLPENDDSWQHLAPGEHIEVGLPAGSYRCMLSRVEGIEPHLSLPLFTTMQAFENQDIAREVALDVLRRLYTRGGDEAHTEVGRNPWEARRTLTRRELLTGLRRPG